MPPALAASATPRILELLGEPPASVVEIGFAGIHAVPLRLAGFDVTVVEPDPAQLERARERAGGDVVPALPERDFDFAVMPEPDMSGGQAPGHVGWGRVPARRVVVVHLDGSASLEE
jgi:hypothetical protein